MAYVPTEEERSLRVEGIFQEISRFLDQMNPFFYLSPPKTDLFLPEVEGSGEMASYIDNDARGDGRQTATVTPGRSDTCEDCYYCDDCGETPATTRFLHLTKGEFFLCETCWLSADHEEDYLEEPDWSCDENREALCECPVPVLSVEHHGNYCIFCWGPVVPLTEEEGDKRVN